MARDEQAMSAERLARTRAHLDRTPIIPFTLDAEAGVARVAMSDVRWAVLTMSDLLAEVERLRAREAALAGIVNAVAVIDESQMTLGEYRWLKEQARALLASADGQGEA